MKSFLHLLSSLQLQISAMLGFTFGCTGLCSLSTTQPVCHKGSYTVCVIKNENPRNTEMVKVLISARYPSSYTVFSKNIADSSLNSTAI